MKAAVLREQPGELFIEDLRVDHPGEGEVLIDVAAAGLCHSDLHFMQAKFKQKVPAVLGHESAGVVREVGPGVRHVQPGDHVVCCTSVFCGECASCLSGHPYACTEADRFGRPREHTPRLSRDDGTSISQFARLGGFAEQMLVSERAVVQHPRRHPARPRRPRRVRRADRHRRRVPHRPDRARQHGGRDRRRRHRPRRHPRCAHRRRRDGDRHRRHRGQAGGGRDVRCHRRRSTPARSTTSSARCATSPAAASTTASRRSAPRRRPSKRSG